MRLHRSGFGFMRCPSILCHSLWPDCWGRACPGWQERKKPLPDVQLDPWSIFSPKCPNSQKASVVLMDVSLPGLRKDKVAQEDGKRCSIARTPTGMEMSQATQGQQPAPSAAAQPAKPLPPSKAFCSAQVAKVGDRKHTLQVQSTNYFTFASQPSLLSELC